MVAPTPRSAKSPDFTWPVVIGAIVLLLVGTGAALVLSVNPRTHCDFAERLIDRYHGDQRLLMAANRELRLVLATHPRCARAWVLGSRLSRAAGYESGDNYDARAIALSHQCARKALEIEPKSYGAHLAEGWSYWCEKDYLMARDEVRKAEALDAGNPRTAELSGRVAVGENRFEDAAREFGSVASSGTADSTLRSGAYEQLALLYAHQDAFHEADSCYRQVIAFDPESAWPRGNYSNFLTSRSRFDDAIGYADQALEMMDYPAGHTARANAHAGRGVHLMQDLHRPQEALAELELALKDEPDDGNIWFNVALAHAQIFRQSPSAAERQAAVAAAARATELQPNDASVRELNAYIATLSAATIP